MMVGFFTIPLFAENSQTLPAGRFRARVKPIYALDFDTQFANDGLKNGLASKFAVSADKLFFERLGTQYAGLVGLMKLKTVDSLGDFAPTLSASTLVLANAVEYGITDNLTLGVIVPVISANTKFDVQFNPSSSVLASGDPTLIGTANALLQKVKDQAASKGYNEFGDWEALGLGDVELGFKYRFLNTEAWTLATKAGVKLPTGRVDDPNTVTDLAFGDGQTDLGTTLLVDYKGIPNTLLNVMTKYTSQLPDRQLLRVPDDGDLFTDKKENIRRNLGNRFDAAVYGEYTFLSVFNVNASYSLFTKEKDRFASDLGYYALGLEKNTAQSKQSVDVGIGFSTLPWFRQGAFALPMDAGIDVDLPLAGRNVADVTTVNLEYKLYF